MSVEQRWNSLLKRLFEDEKKEPTKIKKKNKLKNINKEEI